METLKKVFLFLYEYYNVYFLLISIWSSAGLTLFYNLKKKEMNLFKTLVCIWATLILCSTAVYLYKLLYTANMKVIELAFVLEILVAMASGAVIAYAMCRICMINFRYIQEFYYKNNWGILVFVILFLEFLFNKSENLKPWGSCWYGVDYSMGIGSRFLLGTFLNIITGEKVSTSIAYFFCEVTLVVLIVSVAYLMNIVIKKANEQETWAVLFLILCFISSPGSISGMWTEGNMGRLETYTLLIAFISVIAFCKLKNFVGRYICITILSIIATAIYQGYIFLYFPIGVTLILCDIFKADNGKKNKIIYGLFSCLCVVAAFLFFQFMSYVKFSSAEEMAQAIRSKTDLNVSEEAIHYEFFSSVVETYSALNKPFLIGNEEHPREKTLLLTGLMTPIILIISGLYAVCMKEVKKRKEKGAIFKYPYIYCMIINMAVFPQFLLNVDWGRWMLAVTVNFFFQVLYLFYMDFTEMKTAIRHLNLFINRNKEIAVMCLLYLTIFDKFEDRIYFEQIEKIWEHFGRIFNL